MIDNGSVTLRNYMSNITLRISDLTGGTVLEGLDADSVRTMVNAQPADRWVFIDDGRTRFVRHDDLANIDIAENAVVYVTNRMVAGGPDGHGDCDACRRLRAERKQGD